jgi:hypothetical protein
MMDDEDEFVLDAVGNRVLIGFSLEETIEFELLRFSLPLRSVGTLARRIFKASDPSAWQEGLRDPLEQSGRLQGRNVAFNEEVVDALVELMPKAQPIILSTIGSEQEWRVAREPADHFPYAIIR